MSIEGMLRREIEISTGQRRRENPLLTIGLSPGILSLSIPDSELFSIVRAYAKRVLAKIHSDTVGEDPRPDVANQRKEIIAAFDFLDSEEHFLASIEEFRADHSLEREKVTTLRGRVAALGAHNARLARRNTELEEQRLEIVQLRKQLELQIQQAARAEEIALKTAPTLESAAQDADNRRDRWFRLFKGRTKTLHGVVQSIRQLETYITAQRWVFPPLAVGRPLLPWNVSEVGVMVFELKRKKGKPADDLVPESLPEDPEERAIYDRYREMLEAQLALRAHDTLYLVHKFERLPVHHGEIASVVRVKEDEKIVPHKRTEVLAGSLSFEESLKSSLFELERMPDRLVFKNIAPFLFPGRILAVMRRKYAPEGSSEDKILSDLRHYHVSDGGRRKQIFRTNRIIVSVR